MRRLALILAVTALVSAAWVSEAGAGSCPIRADSLEAFAGCMSPMRGSIGTTTVYSSGKYDRDNARLMSAMMSSDVVPKHSMPVSVGQTFPYYGYYNPAVFANLYFAGNSSYRNNWFRFASFYYPYNRYNPNMWIGAYYAH